MYQKQTLPFDQIPQLSQRDISYQKSESSLRPFYQYEVSMDSFAEVIKNRSAFDTNREVLVSTLLKQYEGINDGQKAITNINLLSKSTAYTIITAHQPSLMTGPLYYIYKICSTIKLAANLKEKYPQNDFVPVFVIGGEDHDFEEIASATFFNKTYTWETDQVGATGRMSLDGLGDVLAQMKDTFGTMPHAEELSAMIDSAYQTSEDYGNFAFRLTHALFGQYGLVVANMDQRAYKEELLPYIIKDVKKEVSYQSVNKDQEALNAAGYKSQAHAREVNIFYHDGDRHRIIKAGDNQYTIDDKSYDTDRLTQLLSEHPENISPNVVLRPLYQELIFPNLAYIGGGGELAYWMERGSMFEAFGVPFPMLIRRDSLLLIDSRSLKTMTQANVSITQLFEREEQIINLLAQSMATVNINLDEARELLKKSYESITKISDQIDPTISKSSMAEQAKALKTIDNIENKLLKAEKRKNETAIAKVTKVKQKLFPGNDSLQERKDNFIPYYLKHGSTWIDAMIDHVDPMDKAFKILIEE